MNDFTFRVHAAIAAIAPIQSVSLGKIDDVATWRVYYAPEATPQQKAAVNLNNILSQVNTAESANVSRKEGLNNDAGKIDLLTRLETATNAQIDNWVDSNVTSLAAARTLFKAILKVLSD